MNLRCFFVWSAIGVPLALASAPCRAADAARGKAFFAQQCSICHTAEAGDNGGAQGPSLARVLGRHAGRVPGFAYTAAMTASDLTWDPATLSRFLASPTTVVPGSSMVIAVANEIDRDDLVAYFQNSSAVQPPSPTTIPPVSQLSADWRLDEPGRMHRINLDALPAPFITPSIRNGPALISRPANADLRLPPGFHIAVFAGDLIGPRNLLVAPNHDVFVSETDSGRVSVLHPSADGSQSTGSTVYAQNLKQPSGLAFYPNARHPRWLYVAETDRIIRYAYRSGDAKPRGDPQLVAAGIPGGGGHYTRDIVFSPDGRHLFVSVGSNTNVAAKMTKKTPEEIKAWESTHGLGASWDDEANRAAVLVMSPAPPAHPQTYSTGLRNCVGLTVQPATGAVWCTVNERDLLGDDLVPDYSTRLRPHGFFGWPWYYLGSHGDPRLQGDRPDLRGKVLVPEIPYQSHSAALSLSFYEAKTGKSAFPAAFAGDGIAAFHGSWNRSLRTGYKLVRVLFKNGEPTGEYQDFLTGFIVDNENVWGRPVATVEIDDGSLLMSDDAGNKVFRISYSP
jgi:glucose/arabinose dehydrogenase/cytochrome c2